MLVKEILKSKGTKVWSIYSDQTVKDALKVLVENKIGALLVLDKTDHMMGILSERDIMRECYKRLKSWDTSPVNKVMTPVVITVNPEEELTRVMELMTENRIRHIPVLMDESTLVGIVSIGDVVKARLKDSEHEMKHIKDYLASS